MNSFAINYRQRTAQTRRVIIHASHTGPEITDTVSHLRVKGRENGLLDIGYHFVIERDGTWENTRFPDRLGSHAPGFNHDSIGICLANGPGEEYPTKEQVAAAKEIIGLLLTEFGPLAIQGHTEVQRLKNRDACPGFDMGQFRSEVNPVSECANAAELPTPRKPASMSEQSREILAYLSQPGNRALTNLIALTNLGIGSLSSRIAELRQMGHNIISTPATDWHGRRYVKYTLGEPT